VEKLKKRVAVLFGGRSAEHEISVQSAASVMTAMDLREFAPIPVGITKSGSWIPGIDPRELLASNENTVSDTAMANSKGSIPEILSTVDVVFPVLHGPYGEDGRIQGLLEVFDLPYVGSGVLSSALGMDKVVQKSLCRQFGIPVVDFVWFTEHAYKSQPSVFHLEIAEKLGFPCFVKPANMGSSVGINKAFDQESLRDFIQIAFKYDRKVLVEKQAPGREIECSVLGNENPQASIPGEVVPSLDFYSYTAKYETPSTLIIPAKLAPQQVAAVQELALRTYQALDCDGLARVDFFLTSSGAIYVNELNTMPGFTKISMYPKMWEASGVSYQKLITELIHLAVAKHSEKNRISVNFRE